MIALFGLAQALHAHVVLPVQVADLRVAVPDIPGKLPVHQGIGALDVGKGLFKVHIKGVPTDAVAHGEAHRLVRLGVEDDALKAQLVEVGKGLVQGALVPGVLMTGAPLIR